MSAQLFKEVRNLTYRVNRFALADLENTVLTVNHLIDKHLNRNYPDLQKDAAGGELVTTNIDLHLTSLFNTLQCGRGSDVTVHAEQFSNGQMEALAKIFISGSPKESDKEEICEVTIGRQIVNRKCYTRVEEDRNQENILYARPCLVCSPCPQLSLFNHVNNLQTSSR